MSANRVGGHRARLFERVAFRDHAGEGRAGDDEAAFFRRREQHGEVVNLLLQDTHLRNERAVRSTAAACDLFPVLKRRAKFIAPLRGEDPRSVTF